MPSILRILAHPVCITGGFKPYYNWNAFNTDLTKSKLKINVLSFKPYYNWNAFNTVEEEVTRLNALEVLNLIITGMPSILIVSTTVLSVSWLSFKPYYNWNAFNTHDFARVLNSWLFSSFFNPRNI